MPAPPTPGPSSDCSSGDASLAAGLESDSEDGNSAPNATMERLVVMNNLLVALVVVLILVQVVTLAVHLCRRSAKPRRSHDVALPSARYALSSTSSDYTVSNEEY